MICGASHGRPGENHRMKANCITLFLPVALAVIACAGCSTNALYEGIRFRAQNDCRRLPPGEVENCLSRTNTLPYDDYERRRQGQKQ